MGIVKMHPFRKWLIEKLGGMVEVPGPPGRIRTLAVNQLNVTRSFMLMENEEEDEKTKTEARRECARKLADALLDMSLIDFEEIKDGLFYNVRGKIRVVVEGVKEAG